MSVAWEQLIGRAPNEMRPTVRLAAMKYRAIEAAIFTATSSVPSSVPSPTCTARCRSSTTQISDAGSSSNSFTISEFVRAVAGQWMRL